MKEQIEAAGTVDEILGIIASTQQQNTSPDITDFKDSLLVGSVQMFLQVMPRFLELSETKQTEFINALTVYHHPDTDPLNRNNAFYTLYELILESPGSSQPSNRKRIERCEESRTPCEDCESTEPTHRIKFTQNNRIEEHFLCTECEESARKGE